MEQQIETAESPPEEEKNRATSSTGIAVLFGVGLAVAFAVGLIAGFVMRPMVIKDVPVQVVVTVIPPVQEIAQVAEPTVAPTNTPAPEATEETSPVSEQTVDPNATPTPSIMEFVLADARHFQGSEDASVTLIEFSDFKWSFCARFANDSLSRIREEYVDTGKVQFVYKHFSILGAESTRSAEASECAAEQDAFWPFHDLVFADQQENHSSLTDEKLVSLAAELGLDADAFGECLSSNQYQELIQQDTQLTQSLGVRGTPGFLVNGVFISGAQPFEVFQQLIDEQLALVGSE